VFVYVLRFISRIRAPAQARSYQSDVIHKKSSQIYHLLALCLQLCPQKIGDESISSAMKEKLNDKDYLAKLQAGEESAFRECFTFACPKFIVASSVVSPLSAHTAELSAKEATKEEKEKPKAEEGASSLESLSSPSSSTEVTPPVATAALKTARHEGTDYQRRCFLREVRGQASIPGIRSSLRLYKVIGLEKLASFITTPAASITSRTPSSSSSSGGLVVVKSVGDEEDIEDDLEEIGSVDKKVEDEEEDQVEMARRLLLQLRLRSMQKVWQESTQFVPLTKFVSDVEYTVDHNVVRMTPTALASRSTRSHVEYMIKQISTLQGVLVSLEKDQF